MQREPALTERPSLPRTLVPLLHVLHQELRLADQRDQGHGWRAHHRNRRDGRVSG